MKRITTLLFLLHSCLYNKAQVSGIDTIKLSGKQADTIVIKELLRVTDRCRKAYSYDSAYYFASRALNAAQKISNKKFEARSYGYLGMIETSRFNYNQSLIFHMKSLDIKSKLKDKIGTANSYNNIGDVYYQLGNYAEALVYHFNSLKMKEELNDKNGIANSYNNIGSVYNALGKFEESIKYHHLSLELKEELNDKVGIVSSYNNLAINYNSLKNYEKALYYHHEALKNNKLLKNKKGIALNLGNIGNCYFYSKEYAKAIDYYKQSLEIREEIKDKKGMSVCYNNLASVYLKQKDFKSTRTNIDKAMLINSEINAISELKDNYFTRSNLNYEEESYKDAYVDYKKYIELRDSIFNQENEKKSTRAQIQYEFEKQQAINEAEYEKQKLISVTEIERQNFLLNEDKVNILLLEQQNQLKEYGLALKKKELMKKDEEKKQLQTEAKIDNQQKNTIIYFVVGIAFLLVILVFVVYRSLLLNKQKNQIVAASLAEKDVLLKEIHHRVKNNLQVISSLLNLQARYISDDKALNAINESKERINAISLLHKEIYQTEVLHMVDAKSYFNSLATNLQNIVDPELKHQLNLSIPNLFLDIDTLIPLGLIINELLTNAYKYGTGNDNCKINFIIEEDQKKITLVVSDNGNGFKHDHDPKRFDSLGIKLISLFAKKINATVDYENRNGACVTIRFIRHEEKH